MGCHDDQPKKFLPGQVSFLAHQNNWKKETYPLTCVIFYLWLWLHLDKETKFIGEDMVFFKNKIAIVGANWAAVRLHIFKPGLYSDFYQYE